MNTTIVKNEFINHVPLVAANLKAAQFWAYKVDFVLWNGAQVHVGYYNNGATVVTFPNGCQQLIVNGMIVDATNVWQIDYYNGAPYVKHMYADGTCVYSSDFSQFALIN